MQKKKKQKLNYGNSYGSENEISKIIKILIGLCAFLIVFYFLALLMTGEIKLGGKGNQDEKKVEIQYDEIIAGETFTKEEEEYYVFYFNFTEKLSSTYFLYRDSYVEKEEHLPMYLVDLEKGFNKGHVTKDQEEREDHPENIEALKVTSPTIIKIKDKKVVERVEGKDEVVELLKELNK
ncbi:MAG: hypothetical protein HFG40_03670 [Bacilli bacterium]|nr:hypothetical protein [Bacilli bacterium]